MTNVHKLELVAVGPGHKLAPNQVLDAARDLLIKVVVIGIEEDGSLYVAASHHAADALWLLEKAKAVVLDSSMHGTGDGPQSA